MVIFNSYVKLPEGIDDLSGGFHGMPPCVSEVWWSNQPCLPSGYVKIAIENDHLWPFIVDFPIKNGDFP